MLIKFKLLGASLIDILHTRLELFSVEAEEEFQRMVALLLFSLAALFCLCNAIVLIVVLLIAAFWDSYRLGILLSLISLFSLGAVALSLYVQRSWRTKPHLFAASLAELKQDTQSLQAEGSADV